MQHVTIKRNGVSTTLPLKLNLKVSAGDSTAIDSHQLEAQMDTHLGWTLRDVGLGEGSPEQAETCKRYIKRFLHNCESDSFYRNLVKESFEPYEEPVCMRYEKLTELEESLGVIYQLMYFHYFLGRNTRMKWSFPSKCCGYSARNLTTALWEAGIAAAVSVHNYSQDHSYVTVPFILTENGRTGIILADPTSDQLWDTESKKIRNHMMVLPSKGWEYKTDWECGRNLYPQFVQLSTCHGHGDKDYHQYMEYAFTNPALIA
jgi:hypothetical protein